MRSTRANSSPAIAGNDTIDGGAGIDFANYYQVPLALGGLNAFLENGSGTVNDKEGGTDTLTNIEGLVGTHSNDTLTGGQGDQWFDGRGGNDFIDGGAGNDWVLYSTGYSTDPSGVTVNLGTGTATDGWNGLSGLLALGGTDTLVSIENAEGSNYNDTITGSSIANELRGGSGNDTLDGGGDNDILVGSAGNDSLTGGTGADTFVIGDTDSGITGATADTITDFTTGSDTLKLGLLGDATAGTGNYVEADAAVADFDAALAAANVALAALNGTSSASELYAFQFDATNGYLFDDTNSDGTADQVIVLTGIADTGIAAADIIA